jgi:hypothetical protein
VQVDTFLESRDVTFFENIFPIKKLYGMSNLPANVIAYISLEPSKNFGYAEHTPELIHEEIDSEAPRQSKCNIPTTPDLAIVTSDSYLGS